MRMRAAILCIVKRALFLSTLFCVVVRVPPWQEHFFFFGQEMAFARDLERRSVPLYRSFIPFLRPVLISLRSEPR